MVVGFITTYAISAYHHSTQDYVVKFVSDLLQVIVFFLGTPVSSTNKTDHHDITEILLKVALNTITLTLTLNRTKIIKLHHIKQNK